MSVTNRRNGVENLRQQGVNETLLEQVASWVKAHPMKEIGVDTPSPFFYYGKEVWEEAISALLAGENLLLVGAKSTGKNVLAENLADLFERPRRNISFHINSDASTLLGTDTFRDGSVQFRPGPVYDVATQGGFGILDEINMARNDAVAVLHATLDFRRLIDLPGIRPIRLQPETRFIATMNEGYLGTRELNEALMSRFMVIQMPVLSTEALEWLLHKHFPLLKEAYVKAFAGLFGDLHRKSINAEISTKAGDLRGLFAALRLMQRGLAPALALDMGLTNKTADPYEQELVRDVLRLRIAESLEAADLFTPNSDGVMPS